MYEATLAQTLAEYYYETEWAEYEKDELSEWADYEKDELSEWAEYEKDEWSEDEWASTDEAGSFLTFWIESCQREGLASRIWANKTHAMELQMLIRVCVGYDDHDS